MLGLGTWELMVIGLALLLLFGPEHIPQMSRKLGKLQGKARSMLRDMEDTMRKEEAEVERGEKKEPPGS